MFVRRTALATVGAAAAVVLLASPALALPAFGTAPVSGPGGGSGGTGFNVVSGVTVGHHPGFDRVVFTLTRTVPPFTVQYVPAIRHDPSDRPVTLQGSAFLLVVLHGTAGSAASAQPTITPGFPMLKQVKGAGDFEAVTSYGIGAARKSGFRAFVLTNPSRLVVDLAIPASPAGAAGSGAGSAGSGAAAGGTSGGTTGGTGGSLAETGGSNLLPLTAGGLGLVALGGAGLWTVRRRIAPLAA
jgi:LPXTG-motif cell wall-anchored protein